MVISLREIFANYVDLGRENFGRNAKLARLAILILLNILMTNTLNCHLFLRLTSVLWLNHVMTLHIPLKSLQFTRLNNEDNM